MSAALNLSSSSSSHRDWWAATGQEISAKTKEKQEIRTHKKRSLSPPIMIPFSAMVTFEKRSLLCRAEQEDDGDRSLFDLLMEYWLSKWTYLLGFSRKKTSRVRDDLDCLLRLETITYSFHCSAMEFHWESISNLFSSNRRVHTDRHTRCASRDESPETRSMENHWSQLGISHRKIPEENVLVLDDGCRLSVEGWKRRWSQQRERGAGEEKRRLFRSFPFTVSVIELWLEHSSSSEFEDNLILFADM